MSISNNLADMSRNLQSDALVWDATYPFLGVPDYHTPILERMAAAGYNCVSLTVATDPANNPETMQYLSSVRRYILGRSDQFVLVDTVEDIRLAKASGKLALVLSFQGTTPFERDLGLVELYYKLGIRHALMAYNQKNHVGDGCAERTDAGLSRFGLMLVAEMERVGMIVDCTHTGLRSTLDVLEASTKPVIFSHSGARALWSHERNINDDQIRRCAETGGVVGVTGVGPFMGENDSSPEAIFGQVDYIAQLVGPQHVGFGFDYVADSSLVVAAIKKDPAKYPGENQSVTQIDFASPESMQLVTEQMLTHGYAEEDIRGILGENWMRVATKCWNPVA